jgi:hypothetical protein
LYCLSFFELLILITPMISIGHCIVCPSSIYWFWLAIWYLLPIVLSVLWLTDSDCPYGICWPLYCLSLFDLRILITPMVSIGHCIVFPPSIYWFWLPLWYLLAIVLSVILRVTDSHSPYGIYWPLRCLFFFDLLILITLMVYIGHCIVCSSSIYGFWLPLWYLLAIVLSVLLRFTDYDCPYGIYWPLYCLIFFDLLILITPMIYIGHCIVRPSSIYWFWLRLWYILAFVLFVLLRFTDSDYSYDIYWPLYCLSFDLLILITSMVYILTIVLFVRLRFTDSDYPYDIYWPLYCLSFFDLLILITPMVSIGHCIVCPSSIYW